MKTIKYKPPTLTQKMDNLVGNHQRDVQQLMDQDKYIEQQLNNLDKTILTFFSLSSFWDRLTWLFFGASAFWKRRRRMHP